MAPSSPGSSPGAAPLPPLPDLSGKTGQGTPGAQDGMAALVAGLGPIKTAVDSILAACQQIVRSGTIPGAETACGQIVALATSLLPMAAQSMMQPGPQAGGMAPAGPPTIPGVGGPAGV